MPASSFVHLHCHSEYSFLDGASRLKDLVAFAAGEQMRAIALTDHGNMHGAIGFYDLCTKHGVKPLLGCEVYVASRSRHERDPKVDLDPAHFLLLAKDETGYHNLMKLVTTAHLEGFYRKPRIDHELLSAHAEGVIGATACVAGEVPRALLAGDMKKARSLVGTYRDLLGKGNFYLELQDHGLASQQAVNPQLIELSRALGVPLIATNDSHYTCRSEASAHDVLLCIQTGKVLSDPNRLRFETAEFYLKTAAEMAGLFSHVPEALTNTALVAEQCNVQLSLGQIHMPHFQVPEGHTLDSYLALLCQQNLPRKYPRGREEAERRLRYELSVIQSKGYSGYFLIVADLVRFARERGIFAAARGSAAGSIVSYLLDITYMDPLEHGLYFERFLNPERESSPDIDLDIEDLRRQEVYDYALQKYGTDNVAQIITFGTMAARAAVRDAGRAMGMAAAKVDGVAKLIPFNHDIQKSLEAVVELKEIYDSDSEAKQLLDYARSIEGLCRHASVHACGVVISHEPLIEHLPLQRPPRHSDASQNGDGATVITQFDGPSVTRCGLVKMDLLGLKNLSVISECLRLIRETEVADLDLSQIPMGDQKTYEMLSRGESTAVFQLESEGMRRLLKDLKPDSFAHLAPLIALYRPGPLDQMGRFVSGRHGASVEYLHPELQPILGETFGVLLYQEQVMQTAVRLADFTPPQAEILMRAMSKKDKEKMQQMHDLFIEKAASRGLPEETAQALFDQMNAFANYGFNKSHSAAYAVISYRTAYLKANYPTQYMAAYMASFMDRTDKIVSCVEECRRLEVEVLPPDVNESQVSFSVSAKGAIRFGLAAIKGIGVGAIEALLEARRAGPFADILDFCERIPARVMTKAQVELLIKSGAFDSLHPNRAQCLAALETAFEAGQKAQRDRAAGQASLFDGNGSGLSAPRLRHDLPDVPDFPREERLALEKELVGLYLSDHPLKRVRKFLEASSATPVNELSGLKKDAEVTVGGLITQLRRISDRNNRPMVFATLEDFTGSVEVVVFSSVYEKCAPSLIKDAIVLVKGRVSRSGRKGSDDDEDPEEIKVLCDKVVPVETEASGASSTHPRNDLSQIDMDFAPPPEDQALTASRLHVRLPQGAEPTLLTGLQSVLRNHPGDCPVVLHLFANGKETSLAAGRAYQVGLTPSLVTQLTKLLGDKGWWREVDE